jgi:hypothetical protein
MPFLIRPFRRFPAHCEGYLMNSHTAVVLVASLVVGDAFAQTPLPRCPLESAVSSVISKLEINIIFKQAYLSEEWLKKLKDADLADAMACLKENNAMLDLAEQNIGMHEEIDSLKRENALLKSRIGKLK